MSEIGTVLLRTGMIGVGLVVGSVASIYHGMVWLGADPRMPGSVMPAVFGGLGFGVLAICLCIVEHGEACKAEKKRNGE
jgi:hypothetical protein